jgi:prohibitin 1
MNSRLAIVLVLAFAFFATGCSVVGPGQRGIRISLGKVNETPLAPGAYLWIPMVYGLQKMNVQIQKADIESSAASKDMQDVRAKVAVNWSLAPENVVRTYKEIGDEADVEQRILAPAVNEVLKAATSKRTAEEVLTKRLEMKKDIDEALLARLKQYGITVHDVSIVNLGFSEGFTQAIEHKQIAEQQAKQASYVAEKATQDARAEIERAKGQAESQRLMKQTITTEILQKMAIEKWDGKFPQVMGGNQTLPFINIK